MPDLILIPTPAERRAIESELRLDDQRWSIETIGFGVIAAGISTANAIAGHAPARVVLAGIAGLFAGHQQPGSSLGDARWFDSVAVDGIGVGQGERFIDASKLGWNWSAHLVGDRSVRQRPKADHPEAVRLECRLPVDAAPALLLTVCSGSSDRADADLRANRFPDAVGEDMEAFAVACACASADVPLSVLRGFSNLVGTRDREQWRAEEALRSVTARLQQMIDENA